MHPNPMAETSRPLFPSFRFCTVFSLLNKTAPTCVTASSHMNDRRRGEYDAFPILPIFCLILSAQRILCTPPLVRRYAGRGDIMRSKAAVHNEKRNNLRAQTIEGRRELARKIAAHTPSLGENPAEVAGLALFRRTK